MRIKMVKNKIGKTAMKPYSMFDFIQAIKERALLWDHNDENFHSRLEREKMWHEIARKLLSNFDHSKTSDKQAIVQMLQKRWKNSRDSYLRAQRLNQTNGEERSYIYDKEMSFLLHCRDDTDDCRDKDRKASESNFDLDPSDKNHPANTNTSRKVETAGRKRHSAVTATNEKQTKQKLRSTCSGSKPKSRVVPQKKRRVSLDSNFSFDSEMEEVCNEIKDQLQQSSVVVDDVDDDEAKAEESSPAAAKGASQPQRTEHEIHNTTTNTNTSSNRKTRQKHSSAPNTGEPDPDQAFFDSIKPNIRKMSADQKLDFQIEILKLLKNYSSK